MFTDPKAIEFFSNEMILAKINAEEDSLTAQKYNIMGFPTSVMINADGSEVDRLVGYAPTEEYIGTFRDYARGIGTLDDLLTKYEANPDREMAFEIADKYKYRGKLDEAADWYGKVIALGEPTDSLSGESRFAIADGHLRDDDYDAALAAFETIAVDFEGTTFGPLAEVYRAVTFRRMDDTTKAIMAFEKFAADYPEHEAADYAREQATKLKGETEAEAAIESKDKAETKEKTEAKDKSEQE